MKKTYSVWDFKGDTLGHTLVGGEGPLRFANGEVDEDCQERLYTFDACSREEAMSIYYLRQGWAPYNPEGEATPCPECGAMYYPMGGGAGAVSTNANKMHNE